MNIFEAITEAKKKEPLDGGDCFKAAIETVRDLSHRFPNQKDDIRLVTGFVNGQGNLDGVRFSHGWAELNGTVFDNSNGRERVFPKNLYYALGGVQEKSGEYASYTIDEMNQKMRSEGTYGPWELTNGGKEIYLPWYRFNKNAKKKKKEDTLTELRVNYTKFDQILANEDIMMGFEVEIVPADDSEEEYNLNPLYGWNDDHTEINISSGNIKSTISSLRNFLKVDVQNTQSATSDTWAVTRDGSLSSKSGVEIISCPYPIGEAVSYLGKVFEWIDKNNFWTDSSTGLHINLSIKGKTIDDYDFLKMIVLFEERDVAKIFDRLHSTYARQMQGVLADLMVNNRDFKNDLHFISDMPRDPKLLIPRRSQTLSTLKQWGRRVMPDFKKYYSINNRGNGVFEFRTMGGEKYHMRFDEIKKYVVKMANILLVGSNDELYREDYLKKVFGMLSKKEAKKTEMNIPKELSCFEKYFIYYGDKQTNDLVTGNETWEPMKNKASYMKVAFKLFKYMFSSEPESKIARQQLKIFMFKHKLDLSELNYAQMMANVSDRKYYDGIREMMGW